jgi:hypothetical protein
MTGLEPATFGLTGQRTTNCATSSIFITYERIKEGGKSSLKVAGCLHLKIDIYFL